MFLKLDGEGELHGQVLRSIKQAVMDGRLCAGSRLPSSRQLADELAVSRNTVMAAYDALCAEQLAVVKVGAGTFVADAPRPATLTRLPRRVEPQSRYMERLRVLPPIALARRDEKLRLDLQYGEPMVNLALFNHWRQALSHAAVHAETIGAPAQGLPVLRREIAAHLRRARAIDCDADDVIVVHGTQQAISLVARLLLDEHDGVALEDPHYQLAAQALKAHGARLHHIPVDAEGLDTAALPAVGMKLVYVTPSHQFPSGRVMSMARRHDLIARAARSGFWIFEDDYDGEFSFEGRRLPAMRSLDRNDRVLYAGTFSKTLLPSIRLGYLVAPSSLRQEIVKARMLEDMSCSAVMQAAVARLMATGIFERHLRRASAELRRRRRVLLEGLRAHCGNLLRVQDSGGGMHVIGWLPAFSAAQADALIRLATRRGLGLHPVRPHYARPPAMEGLLIGFASLSVAQLQAACALLGECLSEIAALERTAGSSRSAPL